jgi:hypothetical protein
MKTISSYVLGGTTTGYDFGYYNYNTLVLDVIAPTSGGLYLKTVINMKE